MKARPPRLLALAAVLGTVSLLGACATAEPTPMGPGAEPSAAPTPSASPTPTPIATIDPADVTCESMLAADALAEFQASGWTVRQDPFVILDLELPEGTACTWGDFSKPTSDDLVLFGWSPLDADDAADAQEALLAEGWRTEEEDGTTIVTEDPDFALRTDAEGYGVTYTFGDGWVAVSDTKQGLELITLPGL